MPATRASYEWPWLMTANGGVTLEGIRHLGLSLGLTAGRAHGLMDHGLFGGIAVKV